MFEILKLRSKIKKALAKDFNLEEFHRQLLSTGTIPIKLARKELLFRLTGKHLGNTEQAEQIGK